MMLSAHLRIVSYLNKMKQRSNFYWIKAFHQEIPRWSSTFKRELIPSTFDAPEV